MQMDIKYKIVCIIVTSRHFRQRLFQCWILLQIGLKEEFKFSDAQISPTLLIYVEIIHI